MQRIRSGELRMDISVPDEKPLDDEMEDEVSIDSIRSNLAGHEATVEVLRQILGAVLGIRIGDDTIAQAVNRYEQKMAVVRGV